MLVTIAGASPSRPAPLVIIGRQHRYRRSCVSSSTAKVVVYSEVRRLGFDDPRLLPAVADITVCVHHCVREGVGTVEVWD